MLYDKDGFPMDCSEAGSKPAPTPAPTPEKNGADGFPDFKLLDSELTPITPQPRKRKLDALAIQKKLAAQASPATSRITHWAEAQSLVAQPIAAF